MANLVGLFERLVSVSVWQLIFSCRRNEFINFPLCGCGVLAGKYIYAFLNACQRITLSELGSSAGLLVFWPLRKPAHINLQLSGDKNWGRAEDDPRIWALATPVQFQFCLAPGVSRDSPFQLVHQHGALLWLLKQKFDKLYFLLGKRNTRKMSWAEGPQFKLTLSQNSIKVSGT